MKNAKLAERPLWAAGFDGLQPGLAEILKDPRDWNAVKVGERCSCHDTEDSAACDAHVIPNGSKIYVDEAWKWFGHLHDASRQSTPKHVLNLAEHRHRGIDFVWTFQQPNQIYPFARGLMGEHHHVVRRFGSKLVDIYTWSELNEDVKSAAKRDNATKQTRVLPREAWSGFKSAEVHTVKMKLPLRLLAIPLGLGVAVVAAYYAYQSIMPKVLGKSPEVSEVVEAAPTKHVPVGGRKQVDDERGRVFEPMSEADMERYKRGYAQAHLPVFATMPWTMPIFDQRSPTADPELFCISSLGGEDGQGVYVEPSCTCQTEQNTEYEITEPECRKIARRGPVYNPYKERRDRQEQRGSTGQGGVVAPAAVVAPAPVGVVLDAPQSSAYGGIKVGQ
jgi:hypothetical protein